MKSLNKKILAFILMAVFAVLMPFGNVKAALQSNPNTQYKSSDVKTPTDWIKQIREMETGQGSMGLNETLNGNLTASSESNQSSTPSTAEQTPQVAAGLARVRLECYTTIHQQKIIQS